MAIYYDRQPPAGRWQNIARDPRDRFEVWTDGNDLYINIYEERERAPEFIKRVIKRLKRQRDEVQKQIDLLKNRNEQSRKLAAQLFDAMQSVKI